MSSNVAIVLTIVLLISAFALGYALLYRKVQAVKIKTSEAEHIIDELLNEKYNFLIKLKEIIINITDVDAKIFEELLHLKEQNLSNINFEKKITVCFCLIEQIKNDYKALIKDESFINNYEELNHLNEKLEAAKTFYNKYTSALNNLIKKMPWNIMAKIHHIVTLNYFEGKDLLTEK